MAIWTPILILAATILPLIALLAVVVAFGLVAWGWIGEIRERRAHRAEVVEHKPAVEPREQRVAEPRIA